MKGGGGGWRSPIPTQPMHLMKRGKSDVRDVVEGGGGLKVGGEEPQVIPPLRSGGLPPKGKRIMVPLQMSDREVLIQRNHVHGVGVGGRLVVG